jgi:phosphoglycolate phosphatase
MVFDLDGTLVDSKDDIARAVNYALVKHALAPLDDELIGKFVGTGVRPLIEQTLARNGIARWGPVIEDFNDFYQQRLAEQTRLYPGILDALRYYEAVPKVVLTNKLIRFAEPLLEKLGVRGLFAACYGRESFPTHKPDPGPLTAISAIFRQAPADIVMIGDTTVDIEAGSRAGALTCAALYGYGNAEDMLAMRPNFRASHAIDLLDLFEP